MPDKTSRLQSGIVLTIFVTPHGLGHASRVCAIIDALLQKVRLKKIIIIGQTPEWFWKTNIANSVELEFYQETVDIGLVQKGPFVHDIALTKQRLKTFLYREREIVTHIASKLNKQEPDLIISDISSLGFLVGSELDLPCVMIENFTWSWIYQDYEKFGSIFTETIERFNACYQLAGLRIQCKPCCSIQQGSKLVPPIFRLPQSSVEKTKRILGIKESENFVLLTTGGIPLRFDQHSSKKCNLKIVIPGNWKKFSTNQNIIFIPMNSGIFFPDLVNASSAVIGKAGYGTICEAWGMRKPFFGIYREDFSESEVLRNFANNHMIHEEISLSKIYELSWVDALKLPRSKPLSKRQSGSYKAASHILEYIE